MVTVCWAAKGGSGTTVVAATLALRAPHPSLLVDLDGELPSVLGIAQPDRPGVADWMASAAPPDHLADLTVPLEGPHELRHQSDFPAVNVGVTEPYGRSRLRQRHRKIGCDG